MRREYDFAKLRPAEPKYLKRLKRAVTMRLDPGVIRYFKGLSESTGLPYQSLINYVLQDYARRQLAPRTGWGEARPHRRKRAG